MNTCVLDIETTDLSAVGAGFILCAVVKAVGKEPVVYRIDAIHDRHGREKRLVKQLVKALGEYDLVVGHNAEGFDLPFIKTRACCLGIPFALHPFTYDTMKAFKRTGLRSRLNGFGKPSAGLDMIVDLLHLRQDKTKIYPEEWWASVFGEPDERKRAMNEIVSHCVSDVAMTELVYRRLLAMDEKGAIKRWR